MDNLLPAIITGVFTLIAIWLRDLLERKRLSKANAETERTVENIDYAGEVAFAIVQILISGVFYYILIAIFGEGSTTFFRTTFVIWSIFVSFSSWNDDSEPHKFAAVLIGCFTVYLIWIFRLDLVDAYHGLIAFLKFGKN